MAVASTSSSVVLGLGGDFGAPLVACAPIGALGSCGAFLQRMRQAQWLSSKLSVLISCPDCAATHIGSGWTLLSFVLRHRAPIEAFLPPMRSTYLGAVTGN